MARPLALAALLLALGPLAPEARAQFGIGGQIGDPTGVSLAFGSGSGAVLLAAGWDLGDDSELSLEGHYVLRAQRIQGEADLALFYGPGVFIRTREDRDPAAGVSFGLGLSLAATRDVEIYGLISPRLQLIDETDFELGGGVGVRLYL